MLDHQEFQPEDDPPDTSDDKPEDESSQAASCLLPSVRPTQPPPSPQAKRDTNTEARGWRENLKLGIELVGLAALIVYTVFSVLQWAQIRYTNQLTARALDGSNKTLQLTLDKMQRQIDAAKTANDLTKKSMIATQSAVVVVESPRPTPFSNDIELLKQQGLYLYFANVGISPSGKFEANAVIARQGLPKSSNLDAPEKRVISAPLIMPGERMPSGIPGFRTNDIHMSFDTSTFTDRDIARILNFEEVVQISGSFSYGDGFGNIRRQPFCFLYAAFPRHVFPESRAITGGGEGSWGMCGDMRRYLSQAEQWRTEAQKVSK